MQQNLGLSVSCELKLKVTSGRLRSRAGNSKDQGETCTYLLPATPGLETSGLMSRSHLMLPGILRKSRHSVSLPVTGHLDPFPQIISSLQRRKFVHPDSL